MTKAYFDKLTPAAKIAIGLAELQLAMDARPSDEKPLGGGGNIVDQEGYDERYNKRPL